MKHTDFLSQYDQLKEQEIAELREAVRANGGSVIFQEPCGTDNGLNPPVILGSDQFSENYSDYRVTFVELGENDDLHIYGYPVSPYVDIDPDEDDCEIENILYGQIGYIIDEIPQPTNNKPQ